MTETLSPFQIETVETSTASKKNETLKRLLAQDLIPVGWNADVDFARIVKFLSQDKHRVETKTLFDNETIGSIDLVVELAEVENQLVKLGLPKKIVSYASKKILLSEPFFSNEDASGYDGHISYSKKRHRFEARGGIDLIVQDVQSFATDITKLIPEGSIAKDDIAKIATKILLGHELGHALIHSYLLFYLNSNINSNKYEGEQVRDVENLFSKLVDNISPNYQINRLKKLSRHTSMISLKKIFEERVAEGILMMIFRQSLGDNSFLVKNYLNEQQQESNELLQILEDYHKSGKSIQNLFYVSRYLTQNHTKESVHIPRLERGQGFGYANPLSQEEIIRLFKSPLT